MADNNRQHHWVVVAESPFLPAHGGGELEHLGFVTACRRAGYLAALVVPTDADAAAVGRDDDLSGIRRLVAPAPVFFTPRRRSITAALSGRRPYPVASRPAPLGLARDVSAATPEATGVIAFSYRCHAVAAALAEGLGLPGVVRMHNLEGRYFHSLATARQPPSRWAITAEAARVAADERRLERARWVRGIADISRTDCAERRARTATPVAYVPTFALSDRPIVDRAWEPSSQHTALFLGALDVPTNHEALSWLCGRVWPRVRQSMPSATLRIVGRRPTAGVRAMIDSAAGIELHADVVDPQQFMRTSGVALNPAVSGSGVNIKLVEYLSTGVPVVSTNLGARGLDLRAGRDVLLHDDPEGFAKAICLLLTDRERARTIGAAGHRNIAHLFDPTESLAVLAELLDGKVRQVQAGDMEDNRHDSTHLP